MVTPNNLKPRIVGFEKKYSHINSKAREQVPRDFKLNMIKVYLSELKNGYMVDVVYRTYKSGTRISFKPYTSIEEVATYVDKVNGMIEDFNLEYKTKIKKVSFEYKEDN